MASTDSEDVPIYSDYVAVYGEGKELSKATERYENLFSEFTKLYNHEPALFSRAPGRVNLIGEHIDYEGYPVLPMAIIHDTVVAIRVVHAEKGATGVLKVANIDSKKYPSVEYPADPKQEVDLKNLKWAHYFLCAFKGVFDHLEEKKVRVTKDYNFEVLVDGRVPTGSGLSSSAALVCSSAIAIVAALGLNLPKNEIAEFCCKCERYIGTISGGMDQSISMLALPGVAMLIEFDPIRAQNVKLPEGASFVIANSLTVSKKAETASTNYNLRVVECQLAAILLAVSTNEYSPSSARLNVATLSDLSTIWDDPQGIVPAVDKHLHAEPYSAAEIESVLGAPLEEIFARSAASLAVLQKVSTFKLNQRAKHVYTEAQRVTSFQETASLVESGKLGSEEALQKLGELMDQSHSSCSQLYECSCPELDELVSVAKSNGALGSRLTGAGWGGCTVSLVKDSQLLEFIQALKDQYFKKKIEEGIIGERDLEDVVFASKPGAGAAIFRL